MRALRSRRVVTPAGVRPATLLVDRERSIASIRTSSTSSDVDVIDAGNAVVMPGLVDAHVHVNEPGRDGLGGLRARDARGGSRRRHDARRHAAQFDPGDDRPCRASTRKQRCGARAARRRRRLLGRCRARQLARSRAALVERRPRLQGFLVPSGVPEFAHVAEADLERALPDARAGSARRSSCTPSCRE